MSLDPDSWVGDATGAAATNAVARAVERGVPDNDIIPLLEEIGNGDITHTEFIAELDDK